MKRLLFIALLFFFATPLFSQYVYTINADSVKITNHCDTAELIIENHTQTVPGFLFNKGRGRTEFRRGVFTIDDTLYLIGGDTLNLAKGFNQLNANNGVLKTSNTLQFGNFESDPYSGPATQIRNTYYNQNSNIFNWLTGSAGIFTVSKDGIFSTTETDVLKGYHTARFYSPQGGIILEGNTNTFNGPLQWISFKNDYASQVSFNYFGDPMAGLLSTGQVLGSNSKYYTNLQLIVANDTSGTALANIALRVSPTVTSQWGVIKIPTTIMQRVEIEDPTPICAPCTNAFNNNNPYSRFVMDAKNFPIVVGNLPHASVAGHILVVDTGGRIWQGDSTSSLVTNGVLNSSLAVNGSVTAHKLKLSQADWPDYVFAPQYHLPGLPEIEQYIRQHNHLPGIPSAAEVQKNGVDVGDNQAALLKKIEELMLYTIEQEKKSQAQDAALKKQQEEVASLKQEMAELKKLLSK